ncbi:MAG: hypothetical protein ACXAEN_18125 [Candidatus Thorarchaeota archaeon]
MRILEVCGFVIGTDFIIQVNGVITEGWNEIDDYIEVDPPSCIEQGIAPKRVYPSEFVQDPSNPNIRLWTVEFALSDMLPGYAETDWKCECWTDVVVSASGYSQGIPPLVCSDSRTLVLNCGCASIPPRTTTPVPTTTTTTTTTEPVTTTTTTTTTPRPGTTTTTTTTTRRPSNGGGGGGCEGLIWAAVIALATGLVLLIFHTCIPPPASGYAFAAGWVLIVLYGVLMAIWGVLSWLGICDQSLCDIARIHLSILAPLALVLAVAAALIACIWQPGYWMFLGVLGAWSSIGARCAWIRR